MPGLDLSTKYSDIRKKLYADLEKRIGKIPSMGTPQRPTTPVDEYKFEPADAQGRWVSPSEAVKFTPLQSTGGVLVSDPTQPGQLIKSTREFSPEFNTSFRNGLPSRLFEIDHVVPLWAGGADVPENKETLTKTEHEKKTKVGAVAQSLYYNKQISLNDARVMQLNWKDKDVTGINLDDKGLTDMDTAVAKQLEWRLPTKVGAKQVIAGLASFLPFIGKPIEKRLGAGSKLYRETMAEGPKGIVGQTAQGLASAATFGFLPAKGRETATEEEAVSEGIARGAGQVAGTLLTFAGLYRVAGGAARAALKMKSKASEATRIAQGIKLGIKEKSALQMAERAPQWLKSLESSSALFKMGRIVLPRNTALRAMQNAGVFILHGQLSKQEESGLQNRMGRFLKDVAWGGLLSMPNQTLKGYGQLALGAYALSALEDPEDTAGAFLNTAIIVGLHGMGKIGDKERMNILGNRVATEKLQNWNIKPEEAAMRLREIEQGNSPITRRIIEEVAPQDQTGEIEALVISLKQLVNGGLTREQRLTEDIGDFKSIVQRIISGSSGLKGIPDEVNNFALKFKTFTESPTIVNPLPTDRIPAGFENKVGMVFSTGVSGAKEIAPDTAKHIREYVKMGGAKGDMVFGIIRDDVPFKNAMAKKKIGSIFGFGGKKRYDFPDKNFQWFGLKDKIYKLGMFPEINNIKNNINPNAEVRGHELMRENFNKDTFVDALRTENKKVITGRIRAIGPEGKKSGQPWVLIDVRLEDWSQAGELNTLFKRTTTERTVAAIQNAPISAKTTQRETLDWLDLRDKSPNLTALLAEMADMLSLPSATMFRPRIEQISGVKVNDAFIENALKNSREKTVGDIIDFFERGYKTNQLGGNGRHFYAIALGPDTYYSSLSTLEREKLKSMFLFKTPNEAIQQRASEIEQKLELKKPVEETANKNVSKIVERIQRATRGVQQETAVRGGTSPQIEARPIQEIVPSLPKTQAGEKPLEIRPATAETPSEGFVEVKPGVFQDKDRTVVIPKESMIQEEKTPVIAKEKETNWQKFSTLTTETKKHEFNLGWKRIKTQLEESGETVKWESPQQKYKGMVKTIQHSVEKIGALSNTEKSELKSRLIDYAKEIKNYLTETESSVISNFKKDISLLNKQKNDVLNDKKLDIKTRDKKVKEIEEMLEIRQRKFENEQNEFTGDRMWEQVLGDKPESFTAGVGKQENVVYRDLKKSATGDKDINLLWQDVINLIDKDTEKIWDIPLKTRNAWRKLNLPEPTFKGDEVTNAVMEKLAGQELSFHPDIVKLSALVGPKRIEKMTTEEVMKSLPEPWSPWVEERGEENVKNMIDDLRSRIKEVRKKYPSTRIFVSAKPEPQEKNLQYYYDLHSEIRGIAKGPEFIKKLKSLGIDKISSEERQGAIDAVRYADISFLSPRLRKAVEEDWMKSRHYQSQGKKKGSSIESLEESEPLSDIETTEIGGQGIEKEMMGEFLANIKTERDFGETTGFNSLTWALVPFELGNLSREEIKEVAKNVVPLIIDGLKKSGNVHKQNNKWYIGKTPLFTVLLAALGITATQKVKAENNEEEDGEGGPIWDTIKEGVRSGTQKLGQKMQDVGFKAFPEVQETLTPVAAEQAPSGKYQQMVKTIKGIGKNIKQKVGDKLIEKGAGLYMNAATRDPSNVMQNKWVEKNLNLSPEGQKTFSQNQILNAETPTAYNYAVGNPQTSKDSSWGMSLGSSTSVARSPRYHREEATRLLGENPPPKSTKNITMGVAAHEFSHSTLTKNPKLGKDFLFNLDKTMSKDNILQNRVLGDLYSTQEGYSYEGLLGDGSKSLVQIYNSLPNAHTKDSFLQEVYARTGEYFGYSKPIPRIIPETMKQFFPQFAD